MQGEQRLAEFGVKAVTGIVIHEGDLLTANLVRYLHAGFGKLANGIR